jgi:hypothetical protein
MNAAVVFDISAGVIAKGQKAWTKIKATTKEQRTLWKEIGNALAIGKQQNPSNQGFSKWCHTYGFGDILSGDRSDAMWFASNPTGNTIPEGMTHPKHIRQWVREQEYEAALPTDLQDIQPETVTVLNESEGRRAAKTILRANSKGEGADIAKRQVAALARKHDTTVEELTEAAKAAAPEVYFQFGPSQVQAIARLYESQRNTVTSMEAYGFTREEIKNVFLKFASTI